MASKTESSLLTKLESSNSTPIYSLFSDYLRPLTNANKQDEALMRTLTKKFISFLNKSLGILPKRLDSSITKEPTQQEQQLNDELLDVYRLCLDCLDMVSSHLSLSSKPYTLLVQRLRLLYSLESCGKYEDAESEGFRLLERFRCLDFSGKSSDSEFARWFVETVMVMVKCAALCERKDDGVYTRVLSLIEEASPWFRVLDANAYERKHRLLVTNLRKCTLFLVEELVCFNGDLVFAFTRATLTEYTKSSMKDQMYKVEMDDCGMEFVELVAYCANKCRGVGTNFCGTVAGHLNVIAVGFPQVIKPIDLIVKLYAAGLYIKNYDVKYRHADLTSSKGAKDEIVGMLLDEGERLHNLADLLASLRAYFYFFCKEKCVSSTVDYEGSVSQICLQSDSNLGASTKCTEKYREAYMLSYLKALKFLCQPLAKLVNLEKNEIIAETEAASFHPQLCTIRDVLYQYCDLFVSLHSCTSERERGGLDDNKTVLTVAVAAFILSTAVYPKMKASKALKLCCRASWTCVVLHCKMFVQKSEGFHDDLLEGAIGDFVNEACANSAFLLDVLHHCGSQNVQLVIVESLENWSVAGSLFTLLPGPMSLLKQWVKIQCELHNNADVEDGAPTLYSLLSSSGKVSKRTIGIILEQQVIQDIDAALNLWLSISIPVHGSANDDCNMFSGNTMLLLYNIVDLLAMKGSLESQPDIYKLLIRLLKWKNVSSEKCLAILWESRRLSHALCVSPVSEAFIMNLAEHCGELSTSVNFWIRCLKEFQPLLVGFQQTFLFLFADLPHGCYIGESSFQSSITIDDVKEAASELISSALSYAKEAHRLRARLLQEKFLYSVEQQAEKYDEAGNIIQKPAYGFKGFQVARSVASEVWSFDADSWEVDSCYLSPWNVLKCYLESTLQVGIIYELVGNGVEAESFLLWGKTISCSQSLPIFMVAFSSVLGKLYRKKRLWDMAEKELTDAKQILVERSTEFSCLKCRLMLEANVDQQLGDISRSHSDSATSIFSIEKLSHAEELYEVALKKLNCSEWKNLVSCPEEANSESILHGQTQWNQPDTMELLTRDGMNAKTEGKKGRKTKNAPKALVREQYLIPEGSSRITRSKSRSSQYQSVNSSNEFSDIASQRKSVSETKSCIIDTGSEASCICNKTKCWQCLPVEVIESGLLDNLINIKWEFVRRQLSLRILNGIGKCMGHHDRIHEAHEIILQSVSVLNSRNSFSHTYSAVTSNSLLDLIGQQFSGDVFAVERALILYNICWLSLKGHHFKGTRKSCCDLLHIQLQKIVSLLKLAFVLCREVPVLFQKVSRLLAAMYILSASSNLFSLSSSCKVLSESHWASFFHQASLGTDLNYQFLSNMSGFNSPHRLDSENLHATGSSDIGSETCNLVRNAPESIQDLEQFVKDFFVGLPCTTIICISLLGDSYSTLLKELLLHPSCVHAWMLLSRLNPKSQPIVILLPVKTLLEEVSNDDNDGNSDFEGLYESKDCNKHWRCPWGSTVVDKVAPAFKLILEENYSSSSNIPFEDTKTNRSLWWMRRKKLDHRLGRFLSKLEDLWLGPWKYMLLGEWSNYKRLDSIHKKLSRDLKSKCKLDVNENLLRVILGGLKCGCKVEEYTELYLSKGCYIGTVGSNYEDSRTPSKGVQIFSELAYQLIHEAVNELEADDSVNREPTVLVLGCEIQMLPWENIPIIRNQEVYRMPSVGSISATLKHHNQEQIGGRLAPFPLIDPLDAFYLLNPGGDLIGTQVEFEEWFRDQNLEGKAGSAPTAEELAVALKNHDLFIYFGHGSGAQYIPRRDLQKLKRCSASLLMGCSSGSLKLEGCYNPHGTPLSYLQAGSPVIVANLWEVTDKDIDRFGKAILDACLRERSSISVGCDQCALLAEEVEAKIARGCKGQKKKVSRKKPTETLDTGLCKNGCDHRPKLGSFMGQAREACTLPFLVGASPVCYGVPTGIRRKAAS
ncbi:hypothetical protein LWI29_017484 [Acer saccharum]|uniref:separase n=1 Tax=Acer saccharum TaxID=4024 RepID=A0AA39SD13_ACESA|nr:hypothetical protein LWI29_017484 [Acer saccharum]